MVTLKVCFNVFAFRANSVIRFQWDRHVKVGIDECIELEVSNADR